MDVHCALHPFRSKCRPTELDTCEFLLLGRAVRRVLSHIEDLPVRRCLTDSANLAYALAKANEFPGVIEVEDPPRTLTVCEGPVEEVRGEKGEEQARVHWEFLLLTS